MAVVETGSSSIDLGIDEESLAAATPQPKRPFADMCRRVLDRAGVPEVHQSMQLASHICGEVSRLPFVQEGVYPIEKNGVQVDVDAVEEQCRRLAAEAEKRLGSTMVWTPAAVAIAKAAIELRQAGEPLLQLQVVKSKEEKSAEVKAARAKLVAD